MALSTPLQGEGVESPVTCCRSDSATDSLWAWIQ
jgi:hypothetical protein